MAKQVKNYTQVPNVILDDNNLNVYEFRIMAHIARQTIGYGKKSDGISLSQFVKATGISKDKCLRTIASMKKKKLIKVVKQTAASGGKSYNRYSLTLVVHKDHLVADKGYPSTSQRQGVVADKGIQKKIEQKKIDIREERDFIRDNNIYFSLSGDELKKEIYNFTEEQSCRANNESAYKAKLKRQLGKQHQETLENFEEWYLNSKCSELFGKYEGKYFKDNPIVSIHNYIKTKGFGTNNKFIIQVKKDNGEDETYMYQSYQKIAKHLKDFTHDKAL